MSFPSAPASSPSKSSPQKSSKNKQKPRPNKLPRSYNSQFELPGKETSGLDFEIFEDPRCAICDGDLPPVEGPQTHLLPQLCASCHLQVTQLKHEREKLQRQKQLDELREALEAVSAQAELQRVLSDGNQRLRGEFEEIEREIGVLGEEVREGEERDREG
ncbi:hypothetical protein BOTCAL_0178g00030 [Botryotinia calthae]|uniref:Uncharacterized protein n=1 Tax=Botryotinia calthae TaxID=38488 RepID=A0A4Y8D0V1_9HELO|nr:hypothetical protein BOTCAL_0178g00030 [Botryotinia calthae]